LDDWSDGVSLLPSTILEARSNQPPPDYDEITNIKTKDDQLAKEIIERASKDQAILRQLLDSSGDRVLSVNDKKSDAAIQSSIPLDAATDSTPSVSAVDLNASAPRFGMKFKRRNSGLNSNRVNLLDIRRRPKWEIKRNRGKKSNSHSHSIQDAEITLYLDRQPPDLSIQRTVGGLNKTLADHCWSVFAAYGDLESKRYH
jgi:hypothetical protein